VDIECVNGKFKGSIMTTNYSIPLQLCRDLRSYNQSYEYFVRKGTHLRVADGTYFACIDGSTNLN